MAGGVTRRAGVQEADAAAELSAGLYLDDDLVAREDFRLAPGEQTTWNTVLSPAGLGARAVEVRLEHVPYYLNPDTPAGGVGVAMREHLESKNVPPEVIDKILTSDQLHNAGLEVGRSFAVDRTDARRFHTGKAHLLMGLAHAKLSSAKLPKQIARTKTRNGIL